MVESDLIDAVKVLMGNHIKVSEEIFHNNSDLDNIINVANLIYDANKKSNKILWFGNGGSAADAQHLSCELVSKFYEEREAINSIALTTNTSILTAVANDYSFENIFERQIEAYAERGDIVIGISTSGKSLNVIRGLKFGKKLGAITISMVGNYTEEVDLVSDFVISVPSMDTPRIQEMHILIGHVICYLVEGLLTEKFTPKENISNGRPK